MTWMSAPSNNASTAAVKLLSRSRIKNRKRAARSPERHAELRRGNVRGEAAAAVSN
jgi:hypothetical protein